MLTARRTGRSALATSSHAPRSVVSTDHHGVHLSCRVLGHHRPRSHGMHRSLCPKRSPTSCCPYRDYARVGSVLPHVDGHLYGTAASADCTHTVAEGGLSMCVGTRDAFGLYQRLYSYSPLCNELAPRGLPTVCALQLARKSSNSRPDPKDIHSGFLANARLWWSIHCWSSSILSRPLPVMTSRAQVHGAKPQVVLSRPHPTHPRCCLVI